MLLTNPSDGLVFEPLAAIDLAHRIDIRRHKFFGWVHFVDLVKAGFLVSLRLVIGRPAGRLDMLL